MSDVIQLPEIENPPAFLARLREGRFVSPSGAEAAFLFDSLIRSVGKKATAHEIADSDDAVLQDLGTATRSYPLDVYFVGDSHDLQADAFFESLAERYTPDAPGILHHPRWGDIPVMPFSFEQSESFVSSGVGISRVAVEFRQTKSLSYPATDGLTQSQIEQQTDALTDDVETAAAEIAVDEPSAYARFRAGMRSAVSVITDAVDGVTGVVQDVQDEVDAIRDDVYTALDAASAPAIIMGQVANLIFTPVEAVLSIPDRINAYIDMTVGVVNSFADRFQNLVSAEDKAVAAQSLQAVGGLCASATAVAALNTEYETREDIGEVIDSLVATLTTYRGAIDTVQTDLAGPIGEVFIPDHNLQSRLADIMAATNQLAINRAFDLKTKKTIRLRQPSDPLTLTWELYNDIGQLAYFLRTNKITANEFVEIPSGRQVVAYV